jgi:putative peptide zinc metalloprotease protein
MMNESLFSTYWYRVAKLKPMLRDTAILFRHVYRGKPWYVLRSSLNGRNHRFNSAAYAIIGQMDGQRTVQEIWENVGKKSMENSPTQDEVIRLLKRLHNADLIQSDILPSTLEMLQESKGQPNSVWKKPWMSNPFYLRFPLFDPDRLLEKWRFISAPIFTRAMFIIWLLAILSALATAVMHWSEISGNLIDKLFLPKNLLLLWLIYPLVKILHEFGHAFAVKKWGGEVHEMGIMLLALTPIPYVDATSSSAFSNKERRIIVAAMGIMVELLLASVALFIWLNVETGLISALAYNVMLIGGVSTLLINGNPFLRHDGYYILADLIEIPNLGQRSTLYLGYLMQRYLLGIETAESPVTASGEISWFLVYGTISFFYRIAILLGIAWIVSGRFFFIGVLIALWGAVSLLVLPGIRSLFTLLQNPAIRNKRSRLGMVGGTVIIVIMLLFFVLPVPLYTTTQGVVWLPEQSIIRAGTDCEVEKVLAPSEQWVDKDTPLLKGVDPFLEADIKIYRADLEELYARYNAQPLYERVKRRMLLDQIELIKGDVHHVEEKLKKLLICSPSQGKFVVIDARNLPGRFVKKGEMLGYVVFERRPTVRAIVNQADIGLLRKRVTGVEVRLAERPTISLKADIKRIVPAADLKLPSAALGTTCGGVITVDPTDPDGMRALESFFQVDLSLPEEEVKDSHIGERVYVKFEHGTMPLAMQLYRSLRQLLLRKFYV